MEITATLEKVLFLPLVSAILGVLFFRRRGGMAAGLSVGSALLGALMTLMVLREWDGGVVAKQWEWFRLGSVAMHFGYLFDSNTALMLLVVTFIGFWIHVFSLQYMAGDEGYGRYFIGLSVFMFSMVGIVLADNLLMLFIFWELVGFSSYALIAHYGHEEAAGASKKAFIVNRVGDVGFLLGIIYCLYQFGTLDLGVLMGKVAVEPGLVKGGIGLLLMCGFLGKSAQFPLHVWLPDAMAGPTPVSALIHAATMVAAGIYMMVRVYFLLTPEVLEMILVLSAGMVVYAGMCGLVQRDIKKVLAYSTLSQLGYMGVALGLGYKGLAMFHLMTHASFKALLFLGAASVIHGVSGEQDIFKMGGLWKRMPVTGLVFLVGMVALCGVNYTSGYFSKDAIIEAAYGSHRGIGWLLLVGAFITSLYMGRLFCIVFLGTGKGRKEVEHAHESGIWMLIPLLVLAVLSLTVGFEGMWSESLGRVFRRELMGVHEMGHGIGINLGLLTTGCWVGGLVLGFMIYGVGSSEDRLKRWNGSVYNFLEKKLWFDEIYLFYVKEVQQRVALVLSYMDVVVLSGLVVRGSAGVVALCSLVMRRLSSGNLQKYNFWILLGVIFLGLYGLGIVCCR